MCGMHVGAWLLHDDAKHACTLWQVGLLFSQADLHQLALSYPLPVK
jgi:hypothetical protein